MTIVSLRQSLFQVPQSMKNSLAELSRVGLSAGLETRDTKLDVLLADRVVDAVTFGHDRSKSTPEIVTRRHVGGGESEIHRLDV